ncbi:hypothetical protein GQ53DRAFT_316555 [Thozetella sp. PMI_491]|nr:hypothetical protein GQ53DRAFT_316555 [Thozetella sp. PMI_491]
MFITAATVEERWATFASPPLCTLFCIMRMPLCSRPTTMNRPLSLTAYPDPPPQSMPPPPQVFCVMPLAARMPAPANTLTGHDLHVHPNDGMSD